MKSVPFLVRSLLALSLMVGAVACETTDATPKKKVVTAEEFDSRNGSVSGLPWNRPRAAESSAGMGRMMPQSR